MKPDRKRDTYWGELPLYDGDFAAEVVHRFEEHQTLYDEVGQTNRILRAWTRYHMRARDGQYDASEIELAGVKGELQKLQLGEFRSLIKSQLIMATAQPPAFQPLALNDDSMSMEACIATKNLLQHYVRAGGLEQARHEWAESALVMTAAWCSCLWNPLKGREYMPEAEGTEGGEMLLFEGDIDYKVHSIFDVAYDLEADDIRNPPWLVVRVRRNRYELAKQVDRKNRDAVLDAKSECDGPYHRARNSKSKAEDETDYVRPYLVFFKPSLLVPSGRMALVLDADTVLSDGPSPYNRVPLVPLFQSRVVGDSTAYADSHDLLNLAELQDRAVSTLASNHAAAHQVMWSQDKEDFDAEDMGPFSVIFTPTKPETLSMFTSPPDAYQWPETILRGIMQRYAMVPDSVRGLNSSQESGAARAFEASTAQAFQGGFARQLVAATEELATLTVEVLRTHVTEERLVAIVGERQRSSVLRFSGESLRPIQRVQVIAGDPALDTPGGRQHVADQLMQKGLIDNAEDYVMALRTGQIDAAEGQKLDQGVLIKRENEQLRDPSQAMPVVTVTENHREHWGEHATVLYDEAVRRDPARRQRVEKHLLEHAMHLTPGMPQYMEAALLMTGQQPLPSPTQQVQNPGGGGAGTADVPPPGPPGPRPNQPPQGNPPGPQGGPGKVAEPPGPKMPDMPTPSGGGKPGAPPQLPTPIGATG